MKHLTPLVAAVAVILPALRSQALETRPISVPVGHSVSEDIGFVPAGYRQQSGEGIVKVAIPAGSTTVVLTAAGGLGKSLIEFPDSAGGEGVLLEVEVVGDLDEVLRSLRRDLDGLDDIEFEKGKDAIRIKGTISSPGDWNLFNKVMSFPEYRDKVRSLVVPGVDATTVGKLRRELESEGIPLAPAGAAPAEGQIAMSYTPGQLNFKGRVFSSADRDALVRVLKAQTWLEVTDGSTAVAETKVPAIVSVSVDDTLLELGVAFVKVSKSASKNLGAFTRDDNGNLVATSLLDVQGVWSGFYDFLTGKHSHNGADEFNIRAGLNTTLTALAGNGVGREREYGTIRFHANGDPDKTLHLGGKMTVTPPASGEGEAPSPQDYEYGFKITNKNSRRLSATEAEADIEIAFDGAPVFENRGGAIIVDQEKKDLHPTVRVPLGQTVAVAGYESLVENTTLPTGTPWLRHIPIVNWFIAGQGEDLQDYTLLFLVSIREVNVEDEAPMVPNTPMKDITLDANTPNQKRANDERARDIASRAGCSPLGWLSRLFQ